MTGSISRRRFMNGVGYGAGAVVTLAFLFALPAKQAKPQDKITLPPPGALSDLNAFHAACIRCGQCVQACPCNTLKLATLTESVAVGAPYFVAREIPCEMCEGIPCIKACPSGALDPNFTDIYEAHMGLAVLLDHETCLAWLGRRCELCYNICPALGEAITIDMLRNQKTGVHAKFVPVIHSEHCTGCGKCERACILDEPAIKVLPLSLAKGQLGQHYRLGSNEGGQAGHALVPSSQPMEKRMPEQQETP